MNILALASAKVNPRTIAETACAIAVCGDCGHMGAPTPEARCPLCGSTNLATPAAVNWNSRHGAKTIHVRRCEGGYYVEVTDHDRQSVKVANRGLLDLQEATALAADLAGTVGDVNRRQQPASPYTRQQLSPLVDAAVARLHCGPRAVKAAELLLAGAVTRLGPDAFTVASQAGDGKTYTVSLRDGCDCPDAGRAPAGWCKHRIAAGFAAKLATPAIDAGTLLSGILARADGQEVQIRVRRHFSGAKGGHPDTDFWQSYRAGDTWHELPVAFDISGHGPFWQALESAGWRVAARHRAPGHMTYTWHLAPMVVPVEWSVTRPATVAA